MKRHFYDLQSHPRNVVFLECTARLESEEAATVCYLENITQFSASNAGHQAKLM